MIKINSAVTYLIIINIAMFFLASRQGVDINTLLALHFPLNPSFSPWQYMSSLFLHGGIFHLLMNMLGLWMFGSAIEQRWGWKRFLFFFFASGLGAGVIYMLINQYQFDALLNALHTAGFTAQQIQELLVTAQYPRYPNLSEQMVSEFYHLYHDITIGASGAVYGILVAFAVLFPNVKLLFLFVPVPIAAKYFVPVLLSIDLLLGMTGFSIFGSNIAHFAHIGGAIVGFVLVILWRKKQAVS